MSTENNNYRGDFDGIHDNETSISSIIQYYKNVGDKLIEYGKKQPTRYYDSYPFDWVKVFTPIEHDAWNIIRCLGHIVLYPQFPVLNYRPDFVNPTLKIILECDGKEFHDEKKDRIRDQILWKEGWKVFRVTGSELYRTITLEENPERGSYGSDDAYTYESLYDYYMTSAEGVICALRDVYFRKRNNPGTTEGQLQIKTLEAHRLINFPIL